MGQSDSHPGGKGSGLFPTVAAGHETDERKARLELADRLTTLGTLSAAIGHELNNPLTYVIGNLSHVLQKLEQEIHSFADPDLQDSIREALDGAERIARIVRDMRSLGGQGAVKLETVDLETALELAVRQTSTHVRHRARLTRHFSAAPLVEADVPRICQVFVNLLLNAAQAIPEGDARRHEISLVLREEESDAIVEISDTGRGIPEHTLARVFEPFFTTKPVGEGTGLGLAISRSIIESLAGRIDISSNEGVGTTVQVRLPKSQATDEEAADVPAALPTEKRRRKRRARILLVDDDPGVLNVAKRLLEKDYEVEPVGDARSALTLLAQGPRVDVILCDLMMPDMNGMELYAEIAKRSAALAARMLFTTGGAFTPEATAFLDSHDRPHLGKPFDRKTLTEAIEQVLDSLPEEPASLPPTTGAGHGEKSTELHLRIPKEWDQLEVVRESCGFFARAAFRDVVVGQRVELVVHELVENAIKYATPDEDRVDVDLQGSAHEFEVAVWNRSSREHVGNLLDVLAELERSGPAEAYASAIRRCSGGEERESAGLGLARIAFEAKVRLAADFRHGAMRLVARGAP
ncbi:MAG TPA: ATP-binding protein [Polyangiaceae bacterium]|nr:ATP-binding protein [Polyangiaceae bacterium]